VVVLNLMIGLMHPPIGLLLFVVSSVGKIRIGAGDVGNTAVPGLGADRAGADHRLPAAYYLAARSDQVVDSRPSYQC